MLRTLNWTILLTIIALTVTLVYAGTHANIGEHVYVREPVNEDLYSAGQHIHVLARINGDLTAAGQRINISEPIEGDINVAAESIHVNAPVGDDVRAAGRAININAALGDHIVAAGDSISLSSKASTQGHARLAGRHIELLGNIGGNLSAAAQSIVIGGEIDGDVEIIADSILIQSSARINGKLVYRSPNEVEILTGAQVQGPIDRLPMPEGEDIAEAAIAAVIGVLLIIGLSILLCGIFYILIFPRFSQDSSQAITQKTLACLGLGVAFLFTTPFLVALLFMTVIGTLLALCLLASYLVSLLAGVLTGLLYFSDLVLHRLFKQHQASRAKRILSFIASSIILALLILIPFIGGLLLLFIVASGLGAVQLQCWKRYTQTDT